jgi:hypothetical protein
MFLGTTNPVTPVVCMVLQHTDRLRGDEVIALFNSAVLGFMTN